MMMSTTLIVLLMAAGIPGEPAPSFPDAPAGSPLKLTIKSGYDKLHKKRFVEATFENTGKTTLGIFRPQDGSYYGWVDPIYDFEIHKKGSKKRVALLPRCGNHGASYGTGIKLAPGKSKTLKLYLVHPLQRGTTYTMRLSYEVRKGRYPGKGVSIPSAEKIKYGAWPKGTFVGKVTSNRITVKW